jgi:hypothetical protein
MVVGIPAGLISADEISLFESTIINKDLKKTSRG